MASLCRCCIYTLGILLLPGRVCTRSYTTAAPLLFVVKPASTVHCPQRHEVTMATIKQKPDMFHTLMRVAVVGKGKWGVPEGMSHP